MPRRIFTEEELHLTARVYPTIPHADWIQSVAKEARRDNGVLPPEELVRYVYLELVVTITSGTMWPHTTSSRIKQLMDEEAAPPPFEAGDDSE